MFSQTIELCESEEQKNLIVAALNLVCATRPYLSGLAVLLKICVMDAVPIAGITPTGRLVINPGFLKQLDLEDLTFILAHELYHLVLRTAERAGNTSWELCNIAHDFIINDELMEDFAKGNRPPAGGYHWPDYIDKVPGWKSANLYSLEEMVTVLQDLDLFDKQSWFDPSRNSSRPLEGGGGSGSLADLLKEAGITPPNSEEEGKDDSESQRSTPSRPTIKTRLDVLTDEDERTLFPNLDQQDVNSERKAIQEAAICAVSEAELLKSLEEKARVTQGTEAGNGSGRVPMRRDNYDTPWGEALQCWLDAVERGERSYAVAPRRESWMKDMIMPGRKRNFGSTLHIVLDTSGSMCWYLPKALGAIEQFCLTHGVDNVHIMQCDTEITVDSFLEVGKLEEFEAKGFGGSDMSPAMIKMAEDPEVTAILVITDGAIDYPKKSPPYQTIWCIVGRSRKRKFRYGEVVHINVRNS